MAGTDVVQGSDAGDAALAVVTGQTPEEQEDAAYEAAFNAEAAKVDARRAGEDPPEVADPDAGKVLEAETPAGEKGEDADEKGTIPPKEGTDKQEAVAKEPAAVEPAWVATLPAEAQVEARKALAEHAEATKRASDLDHANRSLAGRMSAYQRKYEVAVGKRPAEAAKAVKAEASAEWTQFETNYPDIAKAIASRLPQGAGADPTVADLAQFVEEERKTRFLTEAWEAVESVHPGWRVLGATEQFQEWKKSSPTYERLAASDDLSDAVALFDLYKATHPNSASAVPQDVVDPQKAAEAAKLAARRGAQLEGAQAAPNKAATPNHGVDTSDPDQLFAFYAAKSNKRLKARYS